MKSGGESPLGFPEIILNIRSMFAINMSYLVAKVGRQKRKLPRPN
jgi:hypothetical protein